MNQAEKDAQRKIRTWRENPPQFVHDEFGVDPDPWQLELLQAFPNNNRIAMKACKGPGKTAGLSWCVWNFLGTRPFAKVPCTAVSGANLKDNLWSELAKWQKRSEFLKREFEWTSTRIYHKRNPENWFATARTWPKTADAERQADTLAGLHADYLLFVLDESGGIPQAVMATAEAGLASGIETKVLQAGNPTHLEGPLYAACSSQRSLWHLIEITGDPDNPKRSPRISVEWARQQIETYGRDNPWVKVNVFGEFPDASLNALLGPDDISQAMQRHLRPDQYDFAAKVLGLDVSRFGDDQNVLFPRQGRAAFRPKNWRNVRSPILASSVGLSYDKWDADAILIDATGGYGAGVEDLLIAAGKNVIPIFFNGRADDPRYFNKRAEMYFLASEWIKTGGAIPNVPGLAEELLAHTYTYQGDKFRVEDKDQVKEKIGRSPDHSDGFVLTFGTTVLPKHRGPKVPEKNKSTPGDWDPYSEDRIT